MYLDYLDDGFILAAIQAVAVGLLHLLGELLNRAEEAPTRYAQLAILALEHRSSSITRTEATEGDAIEQLLQLK